MRRHAKAPSAGSSMRGGSRLGRIVRGAFATRASSRDAKGSGAPSHAPARSPRPRRLALTATAAALLLALVVLVATAGASKGVLFTFGSTGTGSGQFTTPRGVAVNSTGNGSVPAGTVYVADSADNRVEQFEADGTFVRAWGADVGGAGVETCTASCAPGTAKTGAAAAGGQFSSPQGVAVNQTSGDVYVMDLGNNRVQEFSSTGAFVRTWGWGVSDGSSAFQVCTSSCRGGTGGANGGQFGATTGRLDGLAIDGSGNVVVPDPQNNRVQEFSSSGSFLRAWGWDTIASGKPGDTGTGFEVCTSTVEGDCKAGAAGTGAGQFRNLSNYYAAADSAGNVYVSDTRAARVQKFSSSGAYLSTLTLATASPSVIAVGAADHVFVAENISGSPSHTEIEEFDSAGVHQETFGGTGISTNLGGMAVNANTLGAHAGQIYIAEIANNRIDVIDNLPAATATIDPVTVHTAHTATFTGTVGPAGGDTTYRFEYSADGGATWNPQPLAEVDLGDGSGAGSPASCPTGNPPLCDVSQQAEGLSPNTAYEVRLRARNAFENITLAGPVSFTTDAVAPEVGPAPTGASNTRAILGATVNPENSATTYRFEWGPSATYGHSTADASAGSGGSTLTVSTSINGLSAGATYHYRLTATDSAGTTVGPDRTFVASTALPDGRAYEQVSPVDKNGSEIALDARRTRAAQQLSPGEPMAVGFVSLQAFGDVEGTGVATDYIAVRDPDGQGWSTHAITPRQDPRPGENVLLGSETQYEGEFSPDLSQGVTRVDPSQTPLTPDSLDVQKALNLYLRTDLRDPGPGAYSLLSSCPLCEEAHTTLPQNNAAVPLFAAASEGFGHALFEDPANLTQGASGGEEKLYEAETGSPLRLVGQVPSSGDACGPAPLPACVASPSSEAGPGANGNFDTHWTISRDGSRAFFTVSESHGSAGQLYLRLDHSVSVRINASEKASPEATQPAMFQTATPSGSRAFFLSSEQLTEDDTNNCPDLYMYEAAPFAPDGAPDPGVSHLTRLSVDREPLDAGCGAVGAIGASDDGRYVYFVAQGQLVHGAPIPANDANSNLVYLWHDGAVRYIGALSDTSLDTTENTSIVGVNLAPRQSRVSLDGKHLLFASQSGAGLTGYDHGTCNGTFTGTCRELYLYSAEANGGEGQLQCVSCNPSGATATAEATDSARTATGSSSSATYLNHPLSDDGRFVFFSTAEALVPEDTNGRSDAYSYDTETGQVFLISSGTSSSDSLFLDASPDGKDVFFGTRDQLVGQDADHAYDLYDARIGGGIAAQNPPPAAAPCGGEDCRAGASGAPAASAPGSASLIGPPSPRPRRPRHPRHRHHRAKHRRAANHNRRAHR